MLCGVVCLSLLASAGLARADDQTEALMRQGHWKRVRAIASG